MTPGDLDLVFGPEGWLSRQSPGYRPRPGQRAMAAEVARAILEGTDLIVEGPTGTGKTIAYLVPTLHHIADEKARWLADHPEPDPWSWDETQDREGPEDKDPPPKAVVVTANIALQEQLVARDLPRLAEALPWPFTFGLLKGRTNFLCRTMHAHQALHESPPATVGPDDLAHWRAIVAWGQTTEHGDQSELDFQPSAALWAHFSSPSEACYGELCEHHGRCFPRRAAQHAQSRDVIVTNYHILFANLMVREETGRDLVLPPLRVAILDEAHKAADIARDTFGFRVNIRAVWRVGAALRAIDIPTRDALNRDADAFFQGLAALKATPEGAIRLRQPNLVDPKPLCDSLKAAENAYLTEADAIGKRKDRTRKDLVRETDCRRRSARCGELSEAIEAAMALQKPDDVVFVEVDAPAREGTLIPTGAHGTLCTLPVDVASRLSRHLFKVIPTVVVTSATLAVGASRAKPFDLVRRELGIEEAREAIVESPFDFGRQALLVVPDDLPEPTDPRWSVVAARTVREVVRLARGRTLGLFTSYTALRRAADRCQGLGFKVLVQGNGPRTALIRAFQEEVPSVLLGTESFWAGVDVPGESLSCVVIDRLPFPSPDDPVLDAIRDRDTQWFRNHALPRAIIAFKQGFGRLIRSVDDRGVVVLLDRRLVLRPYGRVFEASLPRMLRSCHLADVRAFLDSSSREHP